MNYYKELLEIIEKEKDIENQRVLKLNAERISNFLDFSFALYLFELERQASVMFDRNNFYLETNDLNKEDYLSFCFSGLDISIIKEYLYAIENPNEYIINNITKTKNDFINGLISYTYYSIFKNSEQKNYLFDHIDFEKQNSIRKKYLDYKKLSYEILNHRSIKTNM